jgi:hypothetical protein
MPVPMARRVDREVVDAIPVCWALYPPRPGSGVTVKLARQTGVTQARAAGVAVPDDKLWRHDEGGAVVRVIAAQRE